MGIFSKLGLGGKKSTPDEFWSWLQGAEGKGAIADILSSTPAAVNRGAAALGKALHKVSPELVWGMRKDGSTGSMQLEIGAGGIRSAVPAVEALFSVVPEIPGLRVVAFKQPLSDFKLELGNGLQLGAEDVAVVAEPNEEGMFDMRVFVKLPEQTPQKVVNEVGFILLDHIFGELLVMKNLGALEFVASQSPPDEATPIGEFAKILSTREEAVRPG